MTFREFLTQEAMTSTADVAGFSRIAIPLVRRIWPSEVDVINEKKRKKKPYRVPQIEESVSEPLSKEQKISIAGTLSTSNLASYISRMQNSGHPQANEAIAFARQIDPYFKKRDGFVPRPVIKLINMSEADHYSLLYPNTKPANKATKEGDKIINDFIGDWEKWQKKHVKVGATDTVSREAFADKARKEIKYHTH